MKDYQSNNPILSGIRSLLGVTLQEFRHVFRDQGVLIFFLLVPLGYPLLYSFIYNNGFYRN